MPNTPTGRQPSTSRLPTLHSHRPATTQTLQSLGATLFFSSLLFGSGIRVTIAQTEKPSTTTSSTKPAEPKSASPFIDKAALKLLKQNQETVFRLSTYQAECTELLQRHSRVPGEPVTRTFLYNLVEAKPNKMWKDAWRRVVSPTSEYAQATTDHVESHDVYDGKNVYDGKQGFLEFDNHYLKDDRTDPKFIHPGPEVWDGFHARKSSLYAVTMDSIEEGDIRELRLLEPETINGTVCQKISIWNVSSYAGKKYESKATWYFRPDHLIVKLHKHVSFDDTPGLTYDYEVHNIVINKPVDESLFVYKPAVGITQTTLADLVKTPPLLATGTPAPDFNAKDAKNVVIKLSDYRGKIVVVDFWATWCAPCMQSMPHTQSVISKLQAAGIPVVLLAVDDGDKREFFNAWTNKKAALYPALTFVHVPPEEKLSSQKFQVSGIPTQYVIDQNGIIRASFVGYGKPTDDLEKAIRACLTR